MTLTITHKYLRNLMDNLSEENFDDFLVELQFSTLMTLADEHGGVPIVAFNGEQYIPLFTDFDELNKFRNHEDYMAVDHEFNFYLELAQNDGFPGFVINPDSERFTLERELLEYIEPNYIFDQDYQPFTAKEIRRIKGSIDNRELNEFIKDESNLWDLDALMKRMNGSTLLTLLMSHKDYGSEAEDGVIYMTERIPKCLYGVWNKNYVLLFSREPSKDAIPDDTIHKYTQIVNFPLLIEEVLNNDFDGFILNVDEENITVPRPHLRDFMKGFICPNLDDYSKYAFTIGEGE